MSQSIPTSTGVLRALLQEIATARDVTPEAILSDSRRHKVAHARQQFMADAYAMGKWSTPQIGGFLLLDHSTVLAGIKSHRARCSRPHPLKNIVDETREPVTNPQKHPILAAR